MTELQTKAFRVKTRSYVANSLHDGGDIVTLKVDPDTFQPGANLEELPDAHFEHTEAQKAAGDKAAAAREESLAKRQPEDKAEEVVE